MFKDKITQFFPSAAKPVQGRILPGFDWLVSQSDPAFLTGWDAYRSSGAQQSLDPKTSLPAFTRWHLEIEVFDGMGADNRDIIIANSSRSFMLHSEQATPADKQDAIADVYYLVKKKAKDDKSYEAYITSDSKRDRPVVARPSTKVLFNVMGVKDGKWVVGAQQMTFTGLKYVKGLLDLFPNPMEPRRDNNWQFLYGDVTHPDTGLLYTTLQIHEDRQLPFNALQFSNMQNTATDVKVVPAGQNELAQRINFWDPSIYNWMTYQEQVDYMINETQTPIEFIAEACSCRANVTARSNRVAVPQGMPQGHVPTPAKPSMPSLPQPTRDFIPGVPGDPSYSAAPPAPVFPPAGWQQHPGNPAYYFKDQEVLIEADLRAKYAPIVPVAAPAPVPAPVMPPLPQALPPQPATPVPMALPGLPQASAPPSLPQAAPQLPVVAPAPTWPPAGWLQHPADPTFYYMGSEVLKEADLRARFAPASPAQAAPTIPAAPAIPSAPAQSSAPQSFAPALASGGTTSGFTEEMIRAKLGAEADEFILLEKKSGDTSGNAMTSVEMDRWIQLWGLIGA